ncbi:MAG: hypothetical protein B7Z70_11235, partial [Acidithiobacillus ferrivorans]
MSSPVTTAALQKSEGLHPTKGSTFVLLEDPATPRTVTKQELTDHLVDTMGLTGKESKRLVESFFNTMRATLAAPPGRRPSWWSWPMVDTWGQQLLTGAARNSPKYTAAWVLNFASQWRQQFHVRHFTLVIDAQWQARLGDPTPSSRFGGFSGMKALIARLHSEGIRVMLWWKLWTDQLPDGKVVRYDPTQPGFTTLLSSQVDQMVGPGPSSLGADGLKLDWGFLVPPPSAEQLARPQLGLGAAVLLRYMRILSSAAWRADPTSLIDASAVAPQFGGTEDTLRLYDAHRASTWSYRAEIVSAVDPNSAIDGDGWALLSSQAIPHIVASSVFGIPSIYYVG